MSKIVHFPWRKNGCSCSARINRISKYLKMHLMTLIKCWPRIFISRFQSADFTILFPKIWVCLNAPSLGPMLRYRIWIMIQELSSRSPLPAKKMMTKTHFCSSFSFLKTWKFKLIVNLQIQSSQALTQVLGLATKKQTWVRFWRAQMKSRVAAFLRKKPQSGFTR